MSDVNQNIDPSGQQVPQTPVIGVIQDGAAGGWAVEGIDEPTFNKALSVASGGAFNAHTELQQAIQARQELEVYKGRIQALEQQDPFASPLVKQLNELARNGAKPEDFTSYVRLSMTDLNSLAPDEALRLKLQFDPAGYSPQMIDAILEEQYGLAPGTDFNSLSPGAQAKIIEAKYAAVQDLQARKVSYEPKPVQVDPNAELNRQAIVNTWQAQVPTLSDTLPFSLPEDKAKGIPGYEFNYKAPADVVSQVRQVVLAEIQKNPERYPATAEGRQQVEGLYTLLLNQATMSDRLEKMALDMYAAMAVKAKSATVGGLPPIPGVPAQQRQAPPPNPGVRAPLTAEAIKHLTSR